MEINSIPTEIHWSCTACDEQLQRSDFVGQKGELLIFRCEKCGNETIIHFVPIPTAKPLDERCAVTVRLRDEIPTVSVLSALRKLSSRFREYPIAKLKKMVTKDGRLELGVYVKGQAMDLQREANRLGLNVVIEECPA
jgi:hypothetical protein